jgi:hypothetical protein
MTVDDCLKRIDTSLLYPAFLVRLREVLAFSLKRGQVYIATSGHRSIELQRERHEAWKRGEGTKANAPGGSGHNFGLAVDLAPDGDPIKPGLQADYRRAKYLVLRDASILTRQLARSSFVISPPCACTAAANSAPSGPR